MGRRNGTEVKDEGRTERKEGTLKTYWFSASGLSRSFYVIPFLSDIIHRFCQVKKDRKKKRSILLRRNMTFLLFRNLVEIRFCSLIREKVFVVVGRLTLSFLSEHIQVMMFRYSHSGIILSKNSRPGTDIQILTSRYRHPSYVTMNFNTHTFLPFLALLANISKSPVISLPGAKASYFLSLLFLILPTLPCLTLLLPGTTRYSPLPLRKIISLSD